MKSTLMIAIATPVKTMPHVKILSTNITVFVPQGMLGSIVIAKSMNVLVNPVGMAAHVLTWSITMLVCVTMVTLVKIVNTISMIAIVTHVNTVGYVPMG